MSPSFTVFKKEVIDALRDRKTLMAALFSSVLMGPLMLVLISTIVSQIETRAEKREVYMVGMENAPSLVNYIQRQTYTIKAAPPDYEEKLKASKLNEPVIVVPVDFEKKLAEGDAPTVEIVTDSGNRNASVGTGRARGLVSGFSQERSLLAMALRGVSGGVSKAIEVDERDLASTQSRSAQFTSIIPTFLMMAVLYGALNAALDTTAGERERGSLEPLLMNPVARLSLVAGKWGAVAAVGMLIATLSVLSFFPAQYMIQSESLQAMFRFGLREGVAFLALLIPFAGALAAMFMAVAIRCKTFKEAQASNTVVLLGVTMAPVLTVINPNGEQPWHLWIPGLGQSTGMSRVLKGEALDFSVVLVPALVSVLITIACLWFITHTLKTAAVK
jgi:sodium transport system permease protein